MITSCRNIIWLGLFLLLTTNATAQSIEYPLQVGNQWIYRSAATSGHSDTWIVEAKALDEFGGRHYLRLEGFPWGTIWLRDASDGKLMIWNPESGTENVWVDFGAGENVDFPSVADACSPNGRITSYEARYSGPIGSFGNAALVKYGPNACADAGLNREYFLPGAGLLHRTYITLAGERSFDLIHASLGGRTYISEPHISFTLALDRHIYELDPGQPAAGSQVMTARLTLRNGHADPIRLQFPTGQIYDLAIRNSRGETVYQWSDGKAFTQAEQLIEFRGERNDVITLRLSDVECPPDRAFPPGSYVAEAWLTTREGQVFRAAVSFEIRHLQRQSLDESGDQSPPAGRL